MPQCCAVPKCSKKTGGHKFPKDKILLKQWLVAIRRDQFTPSNHSLVCKDHFSEDDYELPKDSVLEKPRPKLKKNAVPTIFSWNESANDLLRHKRKDQQLSSLDRDTKKKEKIEKSDKNVSLNKNDNMISNDCVEVDIIPQNKESSTTENDVGVQYDLSECHSNQTIKHKLPHQGLKTYTNKKQRVNGKCPVPSEGGEGLGGWGELWGSSAPSTV